jgi:hypothetical protein
MNILFNLSTLCREGYESLGARVAMANMMLDPRAEPQYGDRIPYVIVSRGPNVKLREKPMAPLAYMSDRLVGLPCPKS